jgi:tetratricopeptide (TPR) repeat protein
MIHPPQHSLNFNAHRVEEPRESPSIIAGSLIRIGCQLFSNGYEADAMAMLESASSLLKRQECGLALCSAVKHLRLGKKVLLQEPYSPIPTIDALDLYQEDECDVGPRLLSTPIIPESVSDTIFLETVLSFNMALIHHERANLALARQLYQAALHSLQYLLSGHELEQQLLELGSRAHNNLGCVYYFEGNEDQAAAHFEASLLCTRQTLDRLEYASVLSNCCRVMWMQGGVNERLYNYLKDILSIRSSLLSWDHADVAASHYNLAVVEYSTHKSQQAIPHFEHYLRVSAHRASFADREQLDRIPAIAYMLLIQNEEKEDAMSQELARGLRTLQDKRQDQGPESPEVASVLNFIGTILFHKKDYSNSLIFFQEELRLEETLCKSFDDISVSVTCNNIGRILQELGNMKEAVHYYQRALKAAYGSLTPKPVVTDKTTLTIAKSFLTDRHPSSANLYSTVWYNLGLIHNKLGCYTDAISAFEMSLELRKVMLGNDHPDIACLLYNIGVLQMELHDLKAASVSFREALCIRRIGTTDQLSDKHVIRTLEKLSSLHKSNGDIAGALETLREVLRIQETSTDLDAVGRMCETGVTLRHIAELYHCKGDCVEALATCSMSVQNLQAARAADLSVVRDNMEQVINIEQFVSSILLLGCLYHEMSEPLLASAVFQKATAAIHHAMASSALTAFASLAALCELTQLLRATHCAAQA